MTISRTLSAISLLAMSLAIADSALAQDTLPADEQNRDTVSSRDIVVIGSIGFHNRSEEAQPVLVYDEQYFQRFEPLTAGDALKRVPSVTFLSDVIESDGARLRGLDPGYTQILINGEKVPGSQADRSFFLDRIPAELIKQVEIVRSSSARRTGDAVAGTLNIQLRDAFTMDGGYVKAGALFFDDGEVKPSGGFYYGGQLGPGRILLGANVQGRYNPKEKVSFRYGDSPENNADYATDDFDDREDQSDIRDGTDYAGNIAYAIDGETTKFEITGNFVRTERTEDERSYEYADPVESGGSVNGSPAGFMLTDNANVNEIEQESYAIASKLSHEWSLGKTTLRAGFNRFQNEEYETEYEIDFDETEPEFEGSLTDTRIVDKELSFGLEHEFQLGTDIKLALGGFFQNKDRSTNIGEAEQEDTLPADMHSWDQFSSDPTSFAVAFDPLEPATGGLNNIEEDRRDAYALIEGKSGPLQYEAGVRWENTKVRIADLDTDTTSSIDYDFLLPSASVKLNLGRGRLTASVARTMRRPRFDYISPALLEGELGDNDLLGNPALKPETAWGGDLGYDHRIGTTGVIGVNLFYRKITDLVEIANTGVEGSEGDGTFVLQPQNTGSGKVWGVEFDMSTSLGFIGLPDTGVFGNLGLIDSSVRDGFGKRRFNGQSKYVYNFGMIQNLTDLGASFGATYRKQGRAFDRFVGQEVTTTYGADLEVFVEKRIGDSFTIRAVGSNLLNGKKREIFNKFDTIEDQVDRDFDEYELEAEEAGPVFQVIARYAF